MIELIHRVTVMKIGCSAPFKAVDESRGLVDGNQFEDGIEDIEIPGAAHTPLSFLQRFCGVEPELYCEKFSARDRTRQWHAIRLSALLPYFEQGRGLRARTQASAAQEAR